jgi:tetratricopeptide (TPR) repeat protein
MKREALRLTRRVLENRRISPEEFGEAVRTIGVLSNFEKWRSELEAAYNRQSRKFKRKTRLAILAVYAALKEWETALKFVSLHNASTPWEIFFSMEVLLALNKLEDAERLATKCKKAFRFANDPTDQSFLIDALAAFLARTHRWEEANAIWQRAPLDQPFRRDALSGIVRIHLGRAWEAIGNGLKALSELKRNPELSLCLPTNDLGLTRDAEKELLKFKRGIEKILPEKARKELGVLTETN